MEALMRWSGWAKSGGCAVVLSTLVVSGGCASSGAVPHPFPMPSRGAPAAARPASPEPAVAAPAPPGAAGNEDPQLPEPSLQDRPAPRLSRGNSLVDTALAFRGVPYRNGGSLPDGFDCSGFTQYVFAEFGIALPRATRKQYGEGQAVDADDLAPGDLVFFSTVAPGASHVGIAIDRDRFVHAPSSTGVVRVERLGASYWSRRYVGARRLKDLDRE
jgi:cell wall-associated NlpC family hydrolase